MTQDPTRVIPLGDDEHTETVRLLRRAMTHEADMLQLDDRLGAITREIESERRPRWLPVLAAVAGVAAVGLVVGLTFGLGDDDEAAAPASPSVVETETSEPSEPTEPTPTAPSPSGGETATVAPTTAAPSPSATAVPLPPPPTTTPSASAEPPPGPPLGGALPVYWVGEQGSRFALFREFGQRGPADAADRVQAAVSAALEGSPADPDYSSPWPDGGTAATSLRDGEIQVDLSSSAVEGASVGSELAEVMVQQLVWTATAAAGQDWPVRFTVDGEAADLFGTVSTAEPIRRGSGATDPRGLVWISTPVEGTTLSAGVPDFAGEGVNASENTLVWTIEQDGAVVEEGFFGVTGSGGQPVDTGERGAWTFSPEQPLSPGEYTLTVEVPDESGGESTFRHLDTKTFTVT